LPHPRSAALEELARIVVRGSGLELHALQVFTHRIPMTLQVMVRQGDGGDVSLDQCAALSGPLGEAFDAEGLLEAPYVLEVSSPGIGEDLLSDRDFTSFRGFPVEVLRRDGAGDERTSAGLLLGRDQTSVQLNVRGRTQRIARSEVVRVRLVTPAGAS
jgi:ribosome maturation factor RimP